MHDAQIPPNGFYLLNSDDTERNDMHEMQIWLSQYLAGVIMFKVVDSFFSTFTQPNCSTRMAALMLQLLTKITAEAHTYKDQ